MTRALSWSVLFLGVLWFYCFGVVLADMVSLCIVGGGYGLVCSLVWCLCSFWWLIAFYLSCFGA